MKLSTFAKIVWEAVQTGCVIVVVLFLVASCSTVRNGGGMIGPASTPQKNIQFCETKPRYWEVCEHDTEA